MKNPSGCIKECEDFIGDFLNKHGKSKKTTSCSFGSRCLSGKDSNKKYSDVLHSLMM